VGVGRLLVWTDRAAGDPIEIWTVVEAVSGGELESVTVTVVVDAPGTVGTPEMIPVEASSVSPTGRVPPVTAQL
jgi:hypothetical protein